MFAASPIFRDARVDFLSELSVRMATKKFEEGKVVITEGGAYRPESDYVYWVVTGQAEVWKGQGVTRNSPQWRHGAVVHGD